MFRVLFLYIVLCAWTEYICFISAKSNWTLFHVSQNLFTIGECCLFLVIYHLHFQNRRVLTLIKVIASIFVLTVLITFLWIDPITKMNNVLTTIEALILIILAVVFFFVDEPEKETGKNQFFFIINLSILLYFVTSFVLFLFSDHLAKADPRVFSFFYGLQKIVNITYNILLAFALWKSNHKRIC